MHWLQIFLATAWGNVHNIASIHFAYTSCARLGENWLEINLTRVGMNATLSS